MSDAGMDSQNIWVQIASAVLFVVFLAIFAFSAWQNYKFVKRLENGM